jgi:hypothetical protein
MLRVASSAKLQQFHFIQNNHHQHHQQQQQQQQQQQHPPRPSKHKDSIDVTDSATLAALNGGESVIDETQALEVEVLPTFSLPKQAKTSCSFLTKPVIFLLLFNIVTIYLLIKSQNRMFKSLWYTRKWHTNILVPDDWPKAVRAPVADRTARIVLVGSSPNIIGSKKGSLVDSAGLVVRFNFGSFHLSGLEEDLGVRTDLMWLNDWVAHKVYAKLLQVIAMLICFYISNNSILFT